MQWKLDVTFGEQGKPVYVNQVWFLYFFCAIVMPIIYSRSNNTGLHFLLKYFIKHLIYFFSFTFHQPNLYHNIKRSNIWTKTHFMGWVKSIISFRKYMMIVRIVTRIQIRVERNTQKICSQFDQIACICDYRVITVPFIYVWWIALCRYTKTGWLKCFNEKYTESSPNFIFP